MAERKTSIDATAAFETLGERIDSQKADLLRELGGKIDDVMASVKDLACGMVRRDVLASELARRDERLLKLEESHQIQDERSATLRNGLIVTAVGAILSLAVGIAMMALRVTS